MFTTVILSDSRGANLGYLLNNFSNEEFKSFAFPGASLTELIFHSGEYIRRFKPKLVVILGGINDMTVMDRITRKVSVRFATVDQCCTHFASIITNARALLHREYPDVIFSFGGITGIDLSKYNGTQARVEDQGLINDSVLEVNRLIKFYNYFYDSPHEYFTTIVHKWSNGSCDHKYELLYDGLHPRYIVVRFWVKQILKLHAKVGGNMYELEVRNIYA